MNKDERRGERREKWGVRGGLTVGPQKRAGMEVVWNWTIIGPAFRKPAPGYGGPRGRAGAAFRVGGGGRGAHGGRQPQAGRGVPPHLYYALKGEGSPLGIGSITL